MKFLCDNCKAKYQIADEKVAGKTVRMKCRKCGHQIEVRAVTEGGPVSSIPPRPSGAPRPPPRSPLASSLAASRPRAPSAPQGSALAGAFQKQMREAPSVPPTDHGSVELNVNDEWYVAINGVPVGPVRLSELRRKAAAGAVTEDSLCWQEGLEEWRPIRSIPELAALVREAAQGGRSSVVPDAPRLTPQAPRPPARGGIAPTPPARSEPPRRPEPPRKASEPPRPAARSNVVPLHGRTASAPGVDEISPMPLGGGIAAARAPAASFAPVPAPPPAPDPFSVPPPPAVDPFAVPPAPIPTPAPAPTIDPFAVLPPAAAPTPTHPSIPPGYVPADQTRRGGVPLWFWPILVVALGFGGTVAFLVFRPQPQPQPVVIQMPATATADKPEQGTDEVPPPEPADSASPAGPTAKKRVASAPKAAAAPASTERKTADLSGLLGGAGGPSASKSGPSATGGGGSFDQAAVERVVANHRAGVKRTCWERVSGPDQKSSVNVTVNATVAPNGTISGTSSSGDDPVVAKCIENQVRTWTFPAPGETRKIALPFKFVRQ